MTTPSEPAEARSRWTLALRVGAVVLLAPPVLVLIAGLALETPWGMRTAANLILPLVRPLDAGITISGARGGFLTGIEVHGVRMRRADGTLDARADTVIARYRLSELLTRSRRLRDAEVAGLSFSVSWPLPESGEEKAPQPNSRPSEFRLDRIELRRANGVVRMSPVGRDSIFELADARIGVANLRVRESTSLAFDTVSAVIRAPAPPPAALRLAAAGALSPGRLDLRAFTLDGDRTRISGKGSLALPAGDRSDVEHTDFRLTFTPFAGSDIRRFLPWLGDPGDLALDFAARGRDSTLHLSLAANAARGGDAKLEADLPAGGGRVILRTAGRVHDLGWGATADSTRFTAVWNADLAGPDVARIFGPFSIDLSGSRMGAMRFDDARVAGSFDAGRATVRVNGAANDYRLEASGHVTPFGASPDYDLSGTLAVPPIHAREGTPALFAGSLPFKIRGRGAKPDSASATASVELEPDLASAPLLGPGHVEASLDRGVAQWHVETGAASGSVRAEGKVHVTGVPRYQLRSAEVTGVDIAKFLGDTTRSRLDARFQAEGRGFEPDSMRATARIPSLTLIFGTHEIRDARARLDLEAGRARLETAAIVDSAHLVARASLAPVGHPREATLDLEFDHLDPDRLAGIVAPRAQRATREPATTPAASRLAGRLSAKLTGPDLPALFTTPGAHAADSIRTRARDADETRGTFQLALEPSVLRGRAIRTFDLGGNLAHGAAELTGALTSDFGHARLAGAARPFDPVPSVRLDRLEVERLDPAALLSPGAAASDSTPAPFDLNGSIAGYASGANPASLEGNATLDFRGSRIQRVTFDQLAGRARLDHGQLDAALDARAGSDTARVTLRGTPFADTTRLVARGALRLDRLGELFGDDSLHARARLAFDADGALPRGGTLQDLRLSARVQGDGRAGEVRVDSLALAGSITPGTLDLERLTMRGNVLTADGAGRVLFPGASARDSSSLRITGRFGRLDTLAPLLGLSSLSATRGGFEFGAAGRGDDLSITGATTARHAKVNEIWADSAEVRFSGRLRADTLANLSARITARSLVPSPFPSRDVDATLDWNGRALAAEIRSLIAGDRRQEIALTLEPQASGVRGRLDRVLHERPGSTITLQSPVRFEFGKRIALDPLVLLENGVPLFRANGDIEENGTVAFQARLDSLNLVELQDLTGVEALGGWVSLSGDLSGTRERPVADVSWHGRLVSGGSRPAPIDGRVHWEDGILDLSAGFDQTPANRLAFTARLPMTLNLAPKPGASAITVTQRPAEAKLESQRFDLSWFQPVISPHVARGLKGWLDGEVKLAGTPREPNLSGQLALEDGRLGLPQLGIDLREATATLGFEGRTIRLERASVQSGGTFEASGTAAIESRGFGALNFDSQFRRFVPVNTTQAKAELDGGLKLGGTPRLPRLSGTLTLNRTTFYAEKTEGAKVEQVELSSRDRIELRERFGVDLGAQERERSFAGDSTDLDLTMKVGDNVWVRRRSDPIVALEMQGDVRTRKAPGTPLDVRGTLGIRTGRSYLSFLGRRFEMLGAQVELPGPIDSVSASLEAFYRPQSNESSSADIEVTANVEMDPSGVVTNLHSDPYLDHASLLNYLATGQVQGGVNSNAATGLAVGSALGAVGGAAGRSLGLDVVTVTMDAYGNQTLGAGSYVNPRVYLGFRQPVVEAKTTGNASNAGSSQTEFEIEVEARRNLLVNLQGSSTQYRFILRPRLGR